MQQDELKVNELVAGAQKGDARAFEGIYELYFTRIYRYLLLKVGDVATAEDLTEDVFVKVLESIRSFQWKGYPFSSWLFRIAHNAVIDHVRKRTRQPAEPLEQAAESPSREFSVEDQVELKLTMAQVKDAMKHLTQSQRDVVTLRLVAGLSLAETAMAVGKKENAVKALQHAGLLRLRHLMAASEGKALRQPKMGTVPGAEG